MIKEEICKEGYHEDGKTDVEKDKSVHRVFPNKVAGYSKVFNASSSSGEVWHKTIRLFIVLNIECNISGKIQNFEDQ